MNNTVKIYLTLYREGSTLVRKSEPDVINYVITAKDKEPHKKFRGKDGLKVLKKGSFKHYSLESKDAVQHINISQECYDSMISKEAPFWANQKEWSRMNKARKIEAHLKRMCEYFGGKSFTYEVLDD